MKSSEEEVYKKDKSNITDTKFDSKEELINKAFNLHSKKNFSEAAKYYQLFIDKGFKDERVFGALVFAKYFNDGDYKARIDNLEGKVVIDFGIDEFNAYAIKPN